MEEMEKVVETVEEVIDAKETALDTVDKSADLPELPDYSSSPWKGIAIGVGAVGAAALAAFGVKKAYEKIKKKIADRKANKEEDDLAADEEEIDQTKTDTATDKKKN